MIYYFIGPSGSGKDTLMKLFVMKKYIEAVQDKSNICIEPIVPFTSRPKREGEVEGVDYLFKDNTQAPLPSLVEARFYDVINPNTNMKDVWAYGTIEPEEFEPKKKDYCEIVTIEALSELLQHFGYTSTERDEFIQIYYIDLPESTRSHRIMERGSCSNKEIERRAEKDKIDFSEEKLQWVKNNFHNFKVIENKLFINNKLREISNNIYTQLLIEEKHDNNGIIEINVPSYITMYGKEGLMQIVPQEVFQYKRVIDNIFI